MTEIIKNGIPYTLITNFQKDELPKMQIAVKASGLHDSIYAEAYNTLNQELSDYYGLYIPAQSYKEQKKEIELFFYATRRVSEEFTKRGLERETT